MDPNHVARVLIVDDEPDLASLMSDELSRHGYSVIRAETGEEGLERVRNDPSIAVVLLDWRLPDMHGHDVLTEVRRIRPYTQLIVMTGFGGVQDAVKAMSSGAYTFMLKPFALASLLPAVEQCLRLSSAESLLAKLTGTVFLSYAHEDVEAVHKIFRDLRGAGFRPWLDTEDLVPGERWRDAIEKAIKSAAIFLACLSSRSVSKRGIVQHEIKVALEICRELPGDQIYLIPLRLEVCEVPTALRDYQWVDYFHENGWNRLVSGLRRALERHVA